MKALPWTAQTTVRGNVCKVSFVQHNTNKYRKASRLNSDLNLSTSNTIQGRIQVSQIPTGLESRRSHLAPKQCAFSRRKKCFGLNWLILIEGIFWTRRKCHLIAHMRGCKYTKSMFRKGRARRGVMCVKGLSTQPRQPILLGQCVSKVPEPGQEPHRGPFH